MSLETLAKNASEALKKHNITLCTAESCTAGGLSYWITSIAGSSDWFDRGFVTYSNKAKKQMLGVNAATLEKHGAVSEAVAREMAEGAVQQSGCDVSIAITGIAGPGGGTTDNPVGTVWFACHNKLSGETSAEIKRFNGDREAVRQQCIEHALMMLCKICA